MATKWKTVVTITFCKGDKIQFPGLSISVDTGKSSMKPEEALFFRRSIAKEKIYYSAHSLLKR